MTLRSRLLDDLRGTPLEPRLERFGEALAAREDAELLDRVPPALVAGLARSAAANPDAARWIAHRAGLLERLAGVGSDAAGLRARGESLPAEPPAAADDLELFLDELRARRRDEEHIAACFDLGGAAPFEAVSDFLSRLAEASAGWALAAAIQGVGGAEVGLAVIGMGKIAGRELTYHSDLDLIFVSEDDPAESTRAPRVAQRLIAYLSTATVAGVAYRIDARLRPSGRQGALVTTAEAFERYQRERAATWEHLALMRARIIAGAFARAAPVLARIRGAVSGRGRAVWDEVMDMRMRVERERGADAGGRVPFKAGRGGLMDVEFLACGALLERGAQPEQLPLPAIPALLRAHAPGKRTDALLDDYALLRRLEARARFVAGRPVEELRVDAETPAVVAELFEPGLGADALLERVASARNAIRAGWERVARERSIRALSD